MELAAAAGAGAIDVLVVPQSEPDRRCSSRDALRVRFQLDKALARGVPWPPSAPASDATTSARRRRARARRCMRRARRPARARARAADEPPSAMFSSGEFAGRYSTASTARRADASMRRASPSRPSRRRKVDKLCLARVAGGVGRARAAARPTRRTARPVPARRCRAPSRGPRRAVRRGLDAAARERRRAALSAAGASVERISAVGPPAARRPRAYRARSTARAARRGQRCGVANAIPRGATAVAGCGRAAPQSASGGRKLGREPRRDRLSAIGRRLSPRSPGAPRNTERRGRVDALRVQRARRADGSVRHGGGCPTRTSPGSRGLGSASARSA